MISTSKDVDTNSKIGIKPERIGTRLNISGSCEHGLAITQLGMRTCGGVWIKSKNNKRIATIYIIRNLVSSQVTLIFRHFIRTRSDKRVLTSPGRISQFFHSKLVQSYTYFQLY